MPITPVINGYVYDLASTPDNNSLNEILSNMAGLNSLTESIQTLSATPPSPSQPTYGWYNTYTESGKYWNFYQNLLTLQGTAGGTYDTAIATVTNEFGVGIPLGGGGTKTFEDIYLALFPSGIQSDATDDILQNSYFNDRLNLVSAVIYMRANLADKIQQAYASLENYYDSTVVMRPSLQNYLLYEYAFASEGILNSEMNILGNTVQANNSALEALNKLGDVMNANASLNMELDILNNSQINNSTYQSAVQSGVDELQDCMGFITSFPSDAPTQEADNGKIKLTFTDVTNADTLFVEGQNVVLSTTTSFPDYAFVVDSASGTTLTLTSLNDLTTVPLADKTKSYFGFYDYDTITQFSSDVSNSFYTVISNSEMYDYISTGSSSWFNNLTAHSDVEAATTNVLYFNDTQKQKLNEAFYIYSKFYQSAASIMTGLDQTISASAQRVKGR